MACKICEEKIYYDILDKINSQEIFDKMATEPYSKDNTTKAFRFFVDQMTDLQYDIELCQICQPITNKLYSGVFFAVMYNWSLRYIQKVKIFIENYESFKTVFKNKLIDIDKEELIQGLDYWKGLEVYMQLFN